MYVAGRLHTSRWEEAQTGEQRSSVELVDDLMLLYHPTSATRAEEKTEQDYPSDHHP